MRKVTYLIILGGLLVIAGLVYLKLKPTDQKKVAVDNTLPKVIEQKPSPDTKISGNSNPNAYSETGWSAFYKPNETELAPDVLAEINVGRSASEIKTVSAKKGQRVQLKFTSAINDQVKVEGYNASVYIMPLGEFSTTFSADKIGEFSISLVNNKKTIGKLVIN